MKAGWVYAVLLAALLTGLNAAKPLHIDDAQYFEYATWIAEHPTDPYGFEVFWFQWPEPAIELLNPLGLPYWLAGAFALGGESELVAKLSLFPFLLLFAFAVRGLLRRFVGVHEAALTWAIGLSPAVLPGINLMLDLPSLALVLAALNLFCSACDSGSPARAALAGAITGVAMQTKYSALVGPGVMLAYGFVHGRVAFALLAGVVATAVFGVVEGAVLARYGRSHFWIQLLIDDPFQRDTARAAMLLPLVANAGAVACTAALLGVAGLLGRVGAVFLGFALAILAVYVSLLFAPLGVFGFALLGFVTFGVGFAVARRLLARGGETTWSALARGGGDPDARFLALWLGLELVAYFVLSPFPAARRMTMLFLVLMLMAGRCVASRAPDVPRRAVLAASVLTAVLGLVFFAVDRREALATKASVAQARERIDRLSPDVEIWFSGHWAFQHYAKQAGMRPVVPDFSRVRAGDWLVIHPHIPRPGLVADPALSREDRVVVDDGIPLATVPDYYAGVWPLHHRSEPRAEVVLLRATTEVVPRTGLPAEAVIGWARERRGPTALAAVPALLAILERAGPAQSREVREVLRALEPELRAAARGDDGRFREPSARALAVLGGADG